MNAILLTMPAVVYVAGISGAIHFANYYRDSVAESGVEGAPARALQAFLAALHAVGRHDGGRIVLAVHQRAGADQMFGIYSAAGVLATLGLLFLFLPAWMQLVADEAAQPAGRRPAQGRRHRPAGPLAQVLAGRAQPLPPGAGRAGVRDGVLRHRPDARSTPRSS